MTNRRRVYYLSYRSVNCSAWVPSPHRRDDLSRPYNPRAADLFIVYSLRDSNGCPLSPEDFPTNPRVRALRETHRYGIPMIHDSRSNRSLAAAAGHRCGVRDPPGHPPNARLVRYSLPSRTVQIPLSRARRAEREPFIIDVTCRNGGQRRLEYSVSHSQWLARCNSLRRLNPHLSRVCFAATFTP